MAANPGGPGGKGPPPSNQNRVLPTQVLTISQNVKHNLFCVQVTPSMAAAATPMAGLATSINPGSDLASLFECPVCFDYVLPPILQVSLLSWMMQILCSFTLNPPLCSATRATWSAPTAGRSSPAAPHAEASLEGTLGTSLWRRCSLST